MKRGPTSDINHDNWDKEEEKEERGQFMTAEKNVISQRRVIMARRKPVSTSNINVFKSFTGNTEKVNPVFNLNASESSVNINKDKHLNSLKLLNQQFLDCIQKHINDNPFCVLTPTLDDYNKNLLTIKEKYPLVTSESSNKTIQSETQPSLTNQISSVVPTFSFGAKDKEPSIKIDFGTKFNETNTVTSTQSLLGEKPIIEEPVKMVIDAPIFGFSGNANKSDSKPTGLDFLKSSSSDSKPTGFGFSTGSSLFGNGINSTIPLFQPKESTQEEEDEVYVPPVVEVNQVKEKDSVYDVRCKLYFQQENEWKIRGVGNLFIKPIEKGKFQLVIRADNSLSTILLNALINDKIPLSVTKNNVSLVAMTDFLKEMKVTPLLIRVKTPEAADELLEAMKKQL